MSVAARNWYRTGPAVETQGTPTGPSRGVRISWGSDGSSRSGCPTGQRCLNLRYEYIGDWGQPPYTLECWNDGQLGWKGQWSGRETSGCYSWGGVTRVVVNGIGSNALAWSDAPHELQLITVLQDHPTLHDNIGVYSWFAGEFGGFGSNNFQWTYAIGNDSQTDSWVDWDMGNVTPGTYRVEVYIPSIRSNAIVQYNILVNGSRIAAPVLNQQPYVGWVSLGHFYLNGQVNIRVNDDEAGDDYRTAGYSQTNCCGQITNAGIAIDAIRLVPQG